MMVWIATPRGDTEYEICADGVICADFAPPEDFAIS
jgi:hypothetical protein